MKRKVWVIAGLLLASVNARAQQHDENERAQLAKALKDTKITLEKALLAAEPEGRPISAKFEVQRGKIELTVYAAKGGDRFAEVNVDPSTGKVSKVEEIKGGGDLAEARSQSESFTRAKRSLRAATERAVKANPGGRAVSVAPYVRSGRPVADVTLVTGDRFKTVTERLD
jgi:uncharacterized membrane protein YkoI